MATVDLNCDMGESFGPWRMGDDAAVLPHVSSASIACGFHAGDPMTMYRTVSAAIAHGVAVGAHPGLPDLAGFGRRTMAVSPEDVYAMVVYQVGALAAFARSQGARLAHVKPHGALYNQAALDETLAGAIARGIARSGPDLILVGLAGSRAMRTAAEAAGLRFAAEAFADRRYDAHGTLVSRRVPGSVIHDPQAAAEQALRIARGSVLAADGREVPLQARTLCLHGDNPNALEIARAVRRALDGAGIELRPLSP